VWIELLLALIIVVLVIWMIFPGGANFPPQRLALQLRRARKEIDRLREINEVLRANLDAARSERTRLFSELCTIASELEQLKAALEGSRRAEEELKQKYGVEPGPESLERILASAPRIDLQIRRRLANEILVGDVGRALMNSLNSGAPISVAATEAEIPLSVAKNKIRVLQTLGYLDERLRLTELGQEALV